MAKPVSERLRDAAYPIGAAVATLVLWEIAVRAFNVPRYILPPPSRVISEGTAHWSSMIPHFWVTLYEALVGLIAAIVVAIPLGMVFSYSALLRNAMYPILVFVDEIPKIAFAPLLVTWFGFGPEPKVILTFVVCFFPIFLNSMAGFSSIEEQYINLGRSAGAREWEMFWKIRIHHALPYVFVGLKMAASVAITGAVVAEFLAADQGLGLYLQKALSELNMALGLAAIALMWVIGQACFYGMSLLESRAIRWHVSRRGPRREIL